MISKEIIGTDKQVLLEILNGNIIRVSSKDCSVTTNSNGVIHEIDFNGIVKYKLHEKIATNINGVNHYYNITSIVKLSDTSFLIYNSTPTKSKTFLLPTLGDFKEDFLLDSLLINCYLGKLHNTLILEYRFIPGIVYNTLDQYLRKNPLLVRVINPDYTTVLYEMEIPEHYLKDVELFIKGSYSRMSDRIKKRILAFHRFNSYGTTAKILYKDSQYRKQLEIELGANVEEHLELYDIPIIENEYYKEQNQG